MVTSVDRAAAEIVGRAVAHAALYPRAHHPAGEAVRVVIAARGAVLPRRHAAELRRPQHERIFEQPALFEVGEQRGGRRVEDRKVTLVIGLERLVRVPVEQAVDAAGPRRAVERDVAHAAFEQPAREQAVARVAGLQRIGVSGAVELVNVLRLTREVRRFRRGELHSRGEFVRGDARGEFIVCRDARAACLAIEKTEQLARRSIFLRAHARRAPRDCGSAAPREIAMP